MPEPIPASSFRGTTATTGNRCNSICRRRRSPISQVHGNDLVISTFGRALWILDDVTPLREISPQIAASDAHLFRPATAMRVRWDNYQDTPYPVETPAGQNPPDGAILDYFLKAAPTG